MKGKDFAPVIASFACVAVIFAIRMCATRFKWNMPKAIIFSRMEKSDDAKQSDAENDNAEALTTK